MMLDECGLSNVKGGKRNLSVIIDPSTGQFNNLFRRKQLQLSVKASA